MSTQSPRPLRRQRVLFALPGFHRVERGAEIALSNVARVLGERPDYDVTMVGSGGVIAGRPYHFYHAGCIPRERFQNWPKFPLFRSAYAYEELTFAAHLLRRYRPRDYDVTLTCAYPYTNWALRLKTWQKRPAHIFVTQNGDWPARRETSEYRFFSCDGLVCTNVDYYERHASEWRCALIPNGVDTTRFRPGRGDRSRFGLPLDRPIVLIVAALIPSKRVVEGIEMVSKHKEVALVVAGDGPLAREVEERGRALLDQRFFRCTVAPSEIPILYRSADLLLHMSQVEPFGNIYVEALATGLPVVAHSTANTRWIFEGQGILVDTSSKTEVLSGIDRALQSSPAEAVERRRELANRRFSWSVIGQAYSDFIHRIADATKAPGSGS